MDRIIRSGFYTTILGMVTLIYCGVLIYQGKSTPSELGGWFLFATTMIRANDTLIGLEKNINRNEN